MSGDGIVLSVTIVVCLIYIYLVDREHRKTIQKIHEDYKEERTALLDRIMANNITEFKTARQDAQVKRSGSGNFLKDRMQAAVKNQYLDE